MSFGKILSLNTFHVKIMTNPPLKKVLIVDDESTIRWFLKAIFVDQSFEIIEATTGEEGIAQAKAIPPDIIIMDYKMPDMNGWKAAREIRLFAPKIPIIGHTGYASKENLQKGLDSGIKEILMKPVDLEVWGEIISRHVDFN